MRRNCLEVLREYIDGGTPFWENDFSEAFKEISSVISVQSGTRPLERRINFLTFVGQDRQTLFVVAEDTNYVFPVEIFDSYNPSRTLEVALEKKKVDQLLLEVVTQEGVLKRLKNSLENAESKLTESQRMLEFSNEKSRKFYEDAKSKSPPLEVIEEDDEDDGSD